MKRIKPKTSEKGITLIALVIMIIILVILAAVGIRALTGKNNLIGTTETAAEDYNITSYKEQIIQQVRSIIITHANLGEEIGISKIAEELNEETIWVKSAIANTDTSIANEDIIVKVTDGYVFQVYYNSTYGTVFIEYVGKDKGEEPPNIKARYEKSIASIVYEATDPEREIEKVEVIYRGEIKHTEERPGAGEKRYNISEIGTGWYILKTTSSSGKLRYAWIKGNNISDRLTPPVIALEPISPNGEAGWYKTGVKVTMTTDSPSAKEIRYRTVTGVANEEEDNGQTGEGTKYESTFDFDTNGSTTIYAWTKDEKGYVSEESKVSFKIDTIKPTIVNPAKITSTKPQVNGWYVSGLEIEIEGTDEGSGLNGYYYMIKGEDTEWNFRDKSEKMKIGENDREGITEIVVKTVDVAGNESEQITINIPKDTVKPVFNQEIAISNETKSSFTVNAYATDPSPSSTINGDKITYECYIKEVIENGTSEWKQIDKGQTNTTGIFNVTGVKTYTNYDIEIRAKDPAGNTESKYGRGQTSVELIKPTFSIKSGTSPYNNGWYNTNVEVLVTAGADQGTGTCMVEYSYTGAMTGTGKSSGTEAVCTINADGETKVVATTVDRLGNRSESAEYTVKRDTAVPTITSTNYSPASTTSITANIAANDGTGSGIHHYQFYLDDVDKGTSTTTTSTITANMGTYTAKAVAYDNAGNVSLAATDSARTLMYAWSKWNTSSVTTYSYSCIKIPGMFNNFSLCRFDSAATTFSGFDQNGIPIISNMQPVVRGRCGCYCRCDFYLYVCANTVAGSGYDNQGGYFDLSYVLTANLATPNLVMVMCLVQPGAYAGCFSVFNNARLIGSGSSITTVGTKGATNYGIVYSNNSSMLPNNSYLGNYWFVNLGAR